MPLVAGQLRPWWEGNNNALRKDILIIGTEPLVAYAYVVWIFPESPFTVKAEPHCSAQLRTRIALFEPSQKAFFVECHAHSIYYVAK